MAVMVAVAGEQPEESPRELTARDVVRLVEGERVPDLDFDDPDVRMVAGGVARPRWRGRRSRRRGMKASCSWRWATACIRMRGMWSS